MTAIQNTTDRIKRLTDMGFALRIVDGPKGIVTEDKWQCIRYLVELTYKGKEVITTDYSLGIGHVDIRSSQEHLLHGEELCMLLNWSRNPSGNFIDKQLQASVAAKLAKYQKVKPCLDDVVSSLVRDGDAFFNAQTFEQWADELGYEKDSRKAEQIYKACDAIGRKLASNVPPSVLNEVREVVQDM